MTVLPANIWFTPWIVNTSPITIITPIFSNHYCIVCTSTTPHCCRHTTISMLADAHVDQTIIKKLLVIPEPWHWPNVSIHIWTFMNLYPPLIRYKINVVTCVLLIFVHKKTYAIPFNNFILHYPVSYTLLMRCLFHKSYSTSFLKHPYFIHFIVSME